MCFIFHTVFFRHLYCFQMAFYLHLKPNDLEAAPSSRSLCSRRITKEYDLQLLVIFMVCSLRSNWRYFIGLSLKSFAAELILKCFSDYLRFAERSHEALLSSSNQCLCLSWSIWGGGRLLCNSLILLSISIIEKRKKGILPYPFHRGPTWAWTKDSLIMSQVL